MCGRFARTVPVEKIACEFGVTAGCTIPPSRNCAPGTDIALITGGDDYFIRASFWGLMPDWGKNFLKAPLINIRQETLTEKKTFSPLLERGRCLVPADGFYEWKKCAAGRHPYFICLPRKQLFYMAALKNEQGCAVITCPAEPSIAGIHHRMPLIFSREEGYHWFSDTFDSLLRAGPKRFALRAEPVSPSLNDPENEGPLYVEKDGD